LMLFIMVQNRTGNKCNWEVFRDESKLTEYLSSTNWQNHPTAFVTIICQTQKWVGTWASVQE
jgi:hypothetical protein